MPLRATIGMKNYSGTACTFNFEKSVCILPEHVDRKHFKVRQLLALFPGTVIEDVGVGTAVEEKEPETKATVGANDEQIKADLEAALAADHAARAKTEEEIIEEVEEEATEELIEDKPLEADDSVLAHYKGEFRKGKVVAVLKSGVVRVKLDDDEAQYRVLDDDKVSRLDSEAAEEADNGS